MTTVPLSPTARPFSATLSRSESQLATASYTTTGTYGNNVTRAWATTAGRGVTVALIDDGFTAGVVANFNTSASRSFAPGTIGEALGSYPHGTTTSGLIGANGANSGIVGVAADATVVGVKVAFGAAPFSQFVNALTYATQTASVVNNSWGFTGFNPDSITSSFYAAWNSSMQTAVSVGRGGLGTAVVFAAGNDRAIGNTVSVQPVQDDPRVIAVAASTADGHVASFSDSGSGLLVAAVGDSVTVPGTTDGSYYVASGTSYAAPLVSGIVTMMLSVNPNLGWRDVQEILAQSAYAPLPSQGGFTTDASGTWNGGGMHFSNDLGFGVVDASVATDLARVWSTQLTSANLQTVSVTQSAALTVGRNATATSMQKFGASLRVEHVQLHIDDVGVPLAHTTLTLISPSGTRSVLLANAGMVAGHDQSAGADLNGDTITSNAFWGEKANGAWMLQVTDSGGAVVGTVRDWTLTVLGDTASTVATPLVYTPEFAGLAAVSPARAVVSNAGHNTTTIDLVDLTHATTINLNGGAGTIDGTAVRVAAGLTNLNAPGCTGPLVVTCATSGSAILGGDGPTTISGAGGSDTITAGGGTTFAYAGADSAMTFIGGTGASTLVVGRGAATLTGGAGADVLTLTKGKSGGSYTFGNFSAGNDLVRLGNYGAASVAQAVASQTDDHHGGTQVSLTDGSRIDFLGVAHVQSSSFTF